MYHLMSFLGYRSLKVLHEKYICTGFVVYVLNMLVTIYSGIIFNIPSVPETHHQLNLSCLVTPIKKQAVSTKSFLPTRRKFYKKQELVTVCDPMV